MKNKKRSNFILGKETHDKKHVSGKITPRRKCNHSFIFVHSFIHSCFNSIYLFVCHREHRKRDKIFEMETNYQRKKYLKSKSIASQKCYNREKSI